MGQKDWVTRDLQTAEQWFSEKKQGRSPPWQWKTWHQVYYWQNNPQLQKGAKKTNLDYSHSFVEFNNVLQGQYKTTWNQVIHKNFPELTDPEMVPTKQDCSSKANFCHAVELFIIKALHKKKPWDQQYIYMMPGDDYNIWKKIKTSPIDHLHCWEEMMHSTGLLPVGNILTSKAQLQVECFYMIFHKSDLAVYMQSRCKLHDKMLQTLAEYFQLIHKTHENNGSLQRHHLKKVWAQANCKMCCKLEEQYTHKLCHLASQRRSHGLYAWHNNGNYCYCQHGQCKQHKLHDEGVWGNNKRNNNKSPPKRKDKDFKPCCLQGKHANHLYKDSRANLRSQVCFKLHSNNNNNNKCRHNCNYNDNCLTSSSDKLCRSKHTPMSSNGNTSMSGKSKAEENFNLSEGKNNKKEVIQCALFLLLLQERSHQEASSFRHWSGLGQNIQRRFCHGHRSCRS